LKTISHAKMAPDSRVANMALAKAVLPSSYEMKRGERNSSPISFIEPELPDCAAAAAACRDDERARCGDGADVHATGSADANAGARGGTR
jgi:hypothetical protein